MRPINKIIRTRGYFKSLEGAYVCYVAQKIIGKIFPAQVFKSLSYKNQALKITTNHYLGLEIKLQQKQIMEQINQKLKKVTVKRLLINH